MMFMAFHANRARLPWLIGIAAAGLLIGIGVLVS
jgi:hypothetical protein